MRVWRDEAQVQSSTDRVGNVSGRNCRGVMSREQRRAAAGRDLAATNPAAVSGQRHRVIANPRRNTGGLGGSHRGSGPRGDLPSRPIQAVSIPVYDFVLSICSLRADAY